MKGDIQYALYIQDILLYKYEKKLQVYVIWYFSMIFCVFFIRPYPDLKVLNETDPEVLNKTDPDPQHCL